MSNKLLINSIIIFVFIMLFSFNAGAITGKIGNGRMILSLEEGEKLDKYIQVINDNNISLNISLYAAGDLENNTEILDKTFILNANEEKRARFIITAGEPGRYEGKINVMFKPSNNTESGVGLSSQIILNVYEKGTLGNDENSSIINFIKNNEIIDSPMGILIASTLILAAAVLILLYLAKRKSRNRGGNEQAIKQITKK